MTRSTLLILLAEALIAPGAPALKPKSAPTYYPTTVGAQWKYQGLQTDDTFAVTRVEKTDDGVLVDVALVSDGREVPTQQMRVSAGGVFRLSLSGVPLSTPECLLKLPHKDGQEWEFDLGPRNGGHSKLTAVRREAVETPAGKFDAIRVERVGGNASTYWFAEGVGLVKIGTGKLEQVLTSFKPGKKD